jgi:glyoxylase-like metal-dependent hydrolase (beta-lactamase superfamily II)/ferredoxin
MALIELRRAENVAGDFFVDETCIDCDLCRQIAPTVFTDIGDQSAVYHQPSHREEEFAALKALVVCPTASIGTVEKHSTTQAVAAFPELIDTDVYFCGFASESSFGASSYLITRAGGNVLIDSPRFNRPLARRIEQLGGVRWIFLTHRDDVADHEKWAEHFNAERILHQNDITRSTESVERVLTGCDAIALADDLLAIPTPGHTRGHAVLLYKNEYLFSGDHVWWSDVKKSLTASRSVNWYSWKEQIRSMERLLDYRFTWVLPGHGRRVNANPDAMREYLSWCIARMSGEVKR